MEGPQHHPLRGLVQTLPQTITLLPFIKHHHITQEVGQIKCDKTAKGEEEAKEGEVCPVPFFTLD